MTTQQIRAHFGTLQQLAADQGSHAGNVENIKAQLMTHASQALTTLDGGMGADEHQKCMREVERLVDEYLTSTRDMQRSTHRVEEAFLDGGQKARTIFGTAV